MSKNGPYKIIDIHTHIFPDRLAGKAIESIGKYYHQSMSGKGTVDALIESGRQIGVSKYVVHSSATHAEQVISINNYVAEVVKTHKNLIGFGTLHYKLEHLNREVDRMIALGLKGIKLHPEFQNFVIDENAMLPVYQAIEGKLPLLIHMGDEKRNSSSPVKLARILELFPNLVVIAAHFGGYRMWDDSIRYLVGKKLYMDTCSSLAFLDPGKATEIIRSHGVNRILFGTDYPMWDHKQEFNRFLRLDLNKEEQEAILYKNSAQLLNIKA